VVTLPLKKKNLTRNKLMGCESITGTLDVPAYAGG